MTLATALSNNVASENTVYNSPAQMDIGGGEITNFNKRGYGEITLARATEVSSNTVFAQLGVQIGAQALVLGADSFGFNEVIDYSLPLATSLMPEPAEMTEWETAWAAAGEPVGQHASPAGPQATVMQMALVGCAIANDGTIMKPYLVDSIYNAEGKCSSTTSPQELKRAVSPTIASRVKSVLEGVVAQGTGTPAQVSGVTIAGKTGTAETGKPKDDSWFVGMGPSEDCKVVVALVLEEADVSASSRAQNVLATALRAQGQLK